MSLVFWRSRGCGKICTFLSFAAGSAYILFIWVILKMGFFSLQVMMYLYILIFKNYQKFLFKKLCDCKLFLLWKFFFSSKPPCRIGRRQFICIIDFRKLRPKCMKQLRQVHKAWNTFWVLPCLGLLNAFLGAHVTNA